MIFIELFDEKGKRYVINPERIQYMTCEQIRDKHTGEISYRTSIRLETNEYVIVVQTPEEIIAKIEDSQMNVFFKPAIAEDEQEAGE